MASLPDGFRFAYGLLGLLGGLVIAGVGLVFTLGSALSVGGGGVGSFVFWFGVLLTVVSPIWYWIGRPVYVAVVGERDAPWYRPPGTLHSNKLVRYGSIGGYSIIGLLTVIIFFGLLSGGGGAETLDLGQTASNDQFEVTVDGYKTVTTIDKEFGGETTAQSGAVFLLLEVKVNNVGETRANAPGGSLSQDFELQYRDTTTAPLSPSDFRASGSQSYMSYPDEVTGAEDDEVFPGNSVSGWLVFEMPENFDPTEAVLRVELEDDSGDDVFSWRLESQANDSEN